MHRTRTQLIPPLKCRLRSFAPCTVLLLRHIDTGIRVDALRKMISLGNLSTDVAVFGLPFTLRGCASHVVAAPTPFSPHLANWALLPATASSKARYSNFGVCLCSTRCSRFPGGITCLSDMASLHTTRAKCALAFGALGFFLTWTYQKERTVGRRALNAARIVLRLPLVDPVSKKPLVDLAADSSFDLKGCNRCTTVLNRANQLLVPNLTSFNLSSQIVAEAVRAHGVLTIQGHTRFKFHLLHANWAIYASDPLGIVLLLQFLDE
mmetsp:Transcript_17940/g.43091  ORF Transcript_17940/g.43091 Transcript_17940/m.43091 type:complete len:265 (-) Transcript_17940:553-1347(-)